MKKNKKGANLHSWRFFRAGGFDQVRLDTAQDLIALDTLDQKLWVALACPVSNVHFDSRTLSLVDSNADGRVRAAELIAAIKWTAALLKDPEELIRAPGEISPESINDATGEGKAILASLRTAQKALGKPENGTLNITEIESLGKVLSEKPFNGDGIITEDSVQDEEQRKALLDVIAAQGSAADWSGKPGITGEILAAFTKEATAYTEWIADGEKDPVISPLGEATEKAAKAIAAVREKIDDYFARCSVARFDERALSSLDGGEKRYENIPGTALTVSSTEISHLPLSRVQFRPELPLGSTLNPAWVAAMKTLETDALVPLHKATDTLSEAGWQELKDVFEPWFAWLGKKPSTVFDALGIGRIRELLKGDAAKSLGGLIEKDLAEATAIGSLHTLEKLVRFRRDLFKLCNNFVNFKDFYARNGGAIFQSGTLYIDQRSCTLCLKIDDFNKHAAMAAMAGTYLLYCECRRHGGAKMNIVAAMTNGDSDNLIVGRNGIFYDRNGDDWDATIVKIIENPISLRQAFWLPYKNLVRMIESQVAKRAMAAEARSTASMENAAVATAHVDATKTAPPPQKKLDIGVVAALGVAAGALGTFVATLLGYTSGIIRMGPLAIAAAIAGLLLLISGPSLILAYIKLRKRNLGPILDAGGWAVNAKACINVPFGSVLTHVATLPPGSQRDMVDPYAEKKSPWPKLIIGAFIIYIAYVVLNSFGLINQWTDGRIGKEGAPKARHYETK
jgi:hypothetical protein